MAGRVLSRLAGSAAGQILVSDVVRQLLAGKEIGFNDGGEMELKGFDAPVRVYEVKWREQA